MWKVFNAVLPTCESMWYNFFPLPGLLVLLFPAHLPAFVHGCCSQCSLHLLYTTSAVLQFKTAFGLEQSQKQSTCWPQSYIAAWTIFEITTLVSHFAKQLLFQALLTQFSHSLRTHCLLYLVSAIWLTLFSDFHLTFPV